MAEIPLSNGAVALVDDDMVSRLSSRTWHLDSRGYARTNRSKAEIRAGHKKSLHMHRLINDTPPALDTDHVNRNRLDNRRANLRTATRSQNKANQLKRQTARSQHKGVTFERKTGKWKARIRFDGRGRHLGTFISERDAAIAYNSAATLIFGDFARLNQIE